MWGGKGLDPSWMQARGDIKVLKFGNFWIFRETSSRHLAFLGKKVGDWYFYYICFLCFQ